MNRCNVVYGIVWILHTGALCKMGDRLGALRSGTTMELSCERLAMQLAVENARAG